jgi:hypothetical protein
LTLFLKVLEKQQEASISIGLFAQKMGMDGGQLNHRALFWSETGLAEAEQAGWWGNPPVKTI